MQIDALIIPGKAAERFAYPENNERGEYELISDVGSYFFINMDKVACDIGVCYSLYTEGISAHGIGNVIKISIEENKHEIS